MYIAGLNIPITETQALNAASWASVIIWVRRCMPGAEFRAKALKEAGPVKSMPPGKQGQLVSATHGLGLFIPIAAFVFSLPFTGFNIPRWLAKTSLPPLEPHNLYVGLRLAGCAGSFAGVFSAQYVFKHLGPQWGAIGVSTLKVSVKPVIDLSTGSRATKDCQDRALCYCSAPRVLVSIAMFVTENYPIDILLNSFAMLEQLMLIVSALRPDILAIAQQFATQPMFWNWIFAPAFVVTAIAFGIKMPMEVCHDLCHKNLQAHVYAYRKR